MAALPYMPLYVADYLADAAHLTTLEHGAYLLLIMTYWQRGEPLPDDDLKLSRIARVTPEEWDAMKATIGEFFEDIGGRWSHSRIDRELAAVHEKSENARRAGKTSAERRSIVRSTPAEQPFNHTDTDTDTDTDRGLEKTSEETSDVCPKPAKRRHSYPSRFEEFWSGYPTDALMSKKKAADAFGRLTDEDQDIAIRSLPAFNAYCSQHNDYRPVHAVKFITDRRFDGFIKAVNAEAQREFVAMDSELWRSLLHLRGVVSMPHKDFNGRRGWTFERTEIERAEKLGPAPNWRGAA